MSRWCRHETITAGHCTACGLEQWAADRQRRYREPRLVREDWQILAIAEGVAIVVLVAVLWLSR